MGLRINTNIASQTVQKHLREVSQEANSSLEKMATGKRINKASDDAAGQAISTHLEAQTKSLRQATRNANDGISMVQTAEGGLNESANILVRLKELAVQSSSDTVSDKERSYIDLEFQQLVQEVDRIAESTSFNGIALLGGDGAGRLEFQVGTGQSEQNRISFDSNGTNASARSLGINKTGVAEKRDARDALTDIDKAIDTVSSQRAVLGSLQSRLNSTISNLEVQTLNQDAAKSVIMDADIAQESSRLASANIAKNTGIATLAQANALPNSVLRLVG